MIFQHTLDKVLSGEKTQTARIWKDSYRIGTPRFLVKRESVPQFYNRSLKQIWNDKKPRRRLYYIGQELSVQPGRGQKGVAKIRVLKLWVQDVRNYTDDDILQEGFSNDLPFAHATFFDVWCDMHDPKSFDFGQHNYTEDNIRFVASRPAKYYIALCIRFELVK